MTTFFLLLHVCTAAVGLLSGFLSMALRKGSGLHAAAGTVFFGSMLCAAGAGGILAIFLRPNSANAIGSTLTFYLVATAWMAAKRRDGKTNLFDYAALVWVSAIVATCATWGVQAARQRQSAAFYFVFGTVALLFAVSDVRMLVRGGVFGATRIARHLWRMGMGLMFATLSFYPGQAKLFPRWLREMNLLHIPAVLLLGALLFWLYRVAIRKRVPRIAGAAV